ncbi:hypothetical protein [Desertihabitans aurantiacus]|uniref:hypothetical protein n=1 Tax=Desertihabitans aurantiacus TaxID=2282477 RepID=UPI000DF85D07|nr:hypothetical protein [Desertihabitans aurantiacus]
MSPEAPLLDRLPGARRQVARAAMALMDAHWDEDAGLFRSPDGDCYQLWRSDQPVHLVRETPMYALGLLLRDGPGDHPRAVRALQTVLDLQLDEPDAVYHGTWVRAPQEERRGPGAVEWRDYDPNWREFIGTTLSLVLHDHDGRLPAALVDRLEHAVGLAVEGTLERDVPPRYTNIALMRAYLLDFAGRRLGHPELSGLAAEQALAVHALFAPHQTFEEYNSPTYYGVNLYALALWRRPECAAVLRELGTQMEAGLWADIARFYHAGLRNLSGPFDRAYSMDMTGYVGYLGLWIAAVVGLEAAPVPDLSSPPVHAWDLCPGVAIGLLGSQPPATKTPHLAAFQGPRTISRTITAEPYRAATAWLGEHVMLGGQRSQSTAPGSSQLHRVTVHWRLPDGRVGWVRLRGGPAVDAEAGPGRVDLHAVQPTKATRLDLELAPAVAAGARVEADRWELPGLVLEVDTDGVLETVDPGPDGLRVRYAPRPDAPGTLTLHLRLRVAGHR